VNRSLLSGRSQQRLIELHRAANVAMQELNQHHSLLIGALLGCDNATQRMMLDEHRAISAAAVEALLKLGTFLNHCRIAEASVDPTT
jgi:hypothetical protein